MSTLSIVATPEPANNPPRVRIDVTDTGTPAINSVTVTRTDNAGRSVPVRTGDGGPLQLTTSGSNRVGTVYDYEMPYGSGVTFSTLEQPAVVSAQVTVDADDVWLVHPGVPSRSMPVTLRIGSFQEETRSASVGVFHPMGRANPVVITDGARHGRESSFTVLTETLAKLNDINALIDDAGVLLLNVPVSMGLGVDTSYIAVMDVRIRRVSSIGSDPLRDVEMPYVVVDRPAGGSQALWAWSDVLAKYATWQQVMAANPTWAALQAPTN